MAAVIQYGGKGPKTIQSDLSIEAESENKYL